MSDIDLIRRALAVLDALAGSPLPGEPTHVDLRNALRYRVDKEDRERGEAAVRTLEGLGYHWNGGSLWRPPLGEQSKPGGIVETDAAGVPLKPSLVCGLCGWRSSSGRRHDCPGAVGRV